MKTFSLLALILSLGACITVQAAPPKPPATSPQFEVQSGVVVPPGTVIMVRMYEGVNTKQHRQGHRWTATLEADLVVDDKTVAPRGSVVYGVVSQLQSAGRLVGKSSMSLTPNQLLIGSRMYAFQASELQAVAQTGSGAKTAGRTARAAAIGGLIDGSDGAKTGAKVGLGASLLSDDGQIQIKEGELVEFQIALPFTL